MLEPGQIYTIPSDLSFVDTLADGILEHFGSDPLTLSRLTVLLPTRRACRSLREAFLRRTGGRALLLPLMRPIGDVDDDELILGDGLDTTALAEMADLPPPASDLRRRLLLAELIFRHSEKLAEAEAGPRDRSTPEQAVRLAADLVRLIDQVHTEGRSLDDLDNLVPDDYAVHWQQILQFLDIVRVFWPKVQEAEGTIDPGLWSTRLRRIQITSLKKAKPEGPVIAAGSTGSIPVTAELIETVLSFPNGFVVLPGLDQHLDGRAWKAVGDSPTHPQYGMFHLLKRFGRDRSQVSTWPVMLDPDHRRAHPDRLILLSEAMRPAQATDAWRVVPDMGQDALDGLSIVTCATQGQEAMVIALALRKAVEKPMQRAALITPDRNLARRVAAELTRWGLQVDDSAGQPLTTTVPGSFLRLLLEAMERGLAPAALLSVLKHPMACGGMAPASFRAQVRALERRVLRGPKPAPGFGGLLALVPDQNEELTAFIETMQDCLGPLFDLFQAGKQPLQTLVKTHLECAEALARDDEDTSGGDRLWSGDAGEAMVRFMMELADATGEDLQPISGRDYVGLFDALLGGQVVRSRFGTHPRLSIWGPQEARLQHADQVVLGGLNDGIWPPEVDADAWMSRPMRQKFGLPPPERRIGLSAHDFAQAFCAPRVLITRAEKSDGTPTVPSRWLSRLDVVMDAAGLSGVSEDAVPWFAFEAALNRIRGEAVPIDRPAPTPPVSARRREMSVTGIETWYADPYGIYARYILNLKPLDALEELPGASKRGSIIHDALERFTKQMRSGPLPDDAYERLIECGRAAFGQEIYRPAVGAFWWPRFLRIADWFIRRETDLRASLVASFIEEEGAFEIDAPAGPFKLTARADRIDQLADGSFGILDYKTGEAPSSKAVVSGRKPQLPLEAALLRHGGFRSIGRGEVSHLAFWRLTGGDPAGKIEPIKVKDMDKLLDEAMEGMQALVARFDDPLTPYLAVPRTAFAPRYNDYEHLARIGEWSAGGTGEDGQ